MILKNLRVNLFCVILSIYSSAVVCFCFIMFIEQIVVFSFLFSACLFVDSLDCWTLLPTQLILYAMIPLAFYCIYLVFI